MCFIMSFSSIIGCEKKVIVEKEVVIREEVKPVETMTNTQKIDSSDTKETTPKPTVTTPQTEPVIYEEPDQYYASVDGFYGVWVAATKGYSEAESFAEELVRKGYYSDVFLTTDWSNLNDEKWYVVSAGVYASREDAETVLRRVQNDYPNAYVKHSGSFQEHYEAYDDKGNMGYNESPQNSGFYGIWFFATKSYEEAEVAAAECYQNGFEGQVYVTSDWSNLNSETWYVVTAGIYTSTADAEAMLPYVQYVYPDAYIKYTGEWRE